MSERPSNDQANHAKRSGEAESTSWEDQIQIPMLGPVPLSPRFAHTRTTVREDNATEVGANETERSEALIPNLSWATNALGGQVSLGAGEHAVISPVGAKQAKDVLFGAKLHALERGDVLIEVLPCAPLPLVSPETQGGHTLRLLAAMKKRGALIIEDQLSANRRQSELTWVNANTLTELRTINESEITEQLGSLKEADAIVFISDQSGRDGWHSDAQARALEMTKRALQLGIDISKARQSGTEPKREVTVLAHLSRFHNREELLEWTRALSEASVSLILCSEQLQLPEGSWQTHLHAWTAAELRFELREQLGNWALMRGDRNWQSAEQWLQMQRGEGLIYDPQASAPFSRGYWFAPEQQDLWSMDASGTERRIPNPWFKRANHLLSR